MYYSEKEFFKIINQIQSEKRFLSLMDISLCIFYLILAIISMANQSKLGIILALFLTVIIWNHLDTKRKKKRLSKVGININKSFSKSYNNLFKWDDFNLSRDEFFPRLTLCYNELYDINKQIYFQSITYYRHFLVFFIPKRPNIQKEKIQNLTKIFKRKIEYLRYSQVGTLIVLSRTKTSSFSAFSNWAKNLSSQSPKRHKKMYQEIKAIYDLIS